MERLGVQRPSRCQSLATWPVPSTGLLRTGRRRCVSSAVRSGAVVANGLSAEIVAMVYFFALFLFSFHTTPPLRVSSAAGSVPGVCAVVATVASLAEIPPSP